MDTAITLDPVLARTNTNGAWWVVEEVDGFTYTQLAHGEADLHWQLRYRRVASCRLARESDAQLIKPMQARCTLSSPFD